MQAEDRYAHLLQPIRDLASNWNVKIADELNEYLVGYWWRGNRWRMARRTTVETAVRERVLLFVPSRDSSSVIVPLTGGPRAN